MLRMDNLSIHGAIALARHQVQSTIVEAISELGSNEASAELAQSESLLARAVADYESSAIAQIRKRLDQGDDIEERGAHFLSPLSAAIAARLWGVSAFLLDRGANALAPSAYGGSLASQALDFGRDDLLAKLAGADLSEVDRNGVGFLAKAASLGHLGCVAFLIQHGADPRALDSCGYTPACAAASLGRCESLALLRELGDDLSLAGRGGLTPLMLAAQAGHDEAVALLLSVGSSPNAAANDGQTALMLATRQGRLPAMRLLLAAGADPNAIDARGESASLRAAQRGDLGALKLLSGAGADFLLAGLREAAQDSGEPDCLAFVEAQAQARILRADARPAPAAARRRI